MHRRGIHSARTVGGDAGSHVTTTPQQSLYLPPRYRRDWCVRFQTERPSRRWTRCRPRASGRASHASAARRNAVGPRGQVVAALRRESPRRRCLGLRPTVGWRVAFTKAAIEVAVGVHDTKLQGSGDSTLLRRAACHGVSRFRQSVGAPTDPAGQRGAAPRPGCLFWQPPGSTR